MLPKQIVCLEDENHLAIDIGQDVRDLLHVPGRILLDLIRLGTVPLWHLE